MTLHASHVFRWMEQSTKEVTQTKFNHNDLAVLGPLNNANNTKTTTNKEEATPLQPKHQD